MKQRVGQYEELARALTPGKGFRLVWQEGGAELWLNCPVGASYLEYRLVCTHDADLTTCVAACGGEPDLMLPEARTDRPRKSGLVGPNRQRLAVCYANVNLFLYRVEMALERFRWYNVQYGFFAESIRSSFPLDDLGLVAVLGRRSNKQRVTLHAQHVWLPKGGGESGTVSVQLVRLGVGNMLGAWCMSKLCARAGPALAQELRDLIAKCKQPRNEHLGRIQEDRQGIYEQLRKVKAAAAQRGALSSAALPAGDILKRPDSLQPQWL